MQRRDRRVEERSKKVMQMQSQGKHGEETGLVMLVMVDAEQRRKQRSSSELKELAFLTAIVSNGLCHVTSSPLSSRWVLLCLWSAVHRPAAKARDCTGCLCYAVNNLRASSNVYRMPSKLLLLLDRCPLGWCSVCDSAASQQSQSPSAYGRQSWKEVPHCSSCCSSCCSPLKHIVLHVLCIMRR